MRVIDVERVAKAIENDAGETIPDLRQALQEASIGAGRRTVPEEIQMRRAHGLKAPPPEPANGLDHRAAIIGGYIKKEPRP